MRLYKDKDQCFEHDKQKQSIGNKKQFQNAVHPGYNVFHKLDEAVF